ncbi:MAG: ImmA/IrrE family metallo-endopeptidase [Candidatus Delongbacteria bacterium]|nr:ImmA/IrrE family metallo-endopeptidase [Candidatus Delongbacteria bacterium]MCG2759668.1 ImmA/IrrE family metallo-endopeptidase [Candidatus Delongbacteria bacterium]
MERVSLKIDFNRNVLVGLLENNHDRAMDLQNTYPKIDQWLIAKENPTMKQLADIADKFNIPFGYFFLENIPQKEYSLPHFRTNGQRTFNPSSELVDTVGTIKERQTWASEILRELRDDKLTFANSLNINDSVESAVESVKNILGLTGDWAEEMPTWTEAFTTIISKAEAAGIFVAVNGVVNNNTHRKLSVDEFRGFVLYDDFAPFIFVNNRDVVSAKIFTIIHEITHILIGKSASFDLRQLTPASDPAELFCDRTAAEFLVPAAKLTEKFKTYGKNYESLARAFKVSQIVIARRLYDLGKITREEFFAFYEAHISKETNTPAGTGGNFYNTVPYRISKRFFELIHNTVQQNKILYTDAFRLT